MLAPEAKLHNGGVKSTHLYLCSDHHFTRMAKFPRWSRLKHFNSVTTTKFTDGNTFYDILKVRATVFEVLI